MQKVVEKVNSVFSNPFLRGVLTAYRVLIVLTLFALLLFFAEPGWYWPAFAVALFGEFIQLWCFASLDKQGELAFNGLYKHVRNPMYLGRFFVVLGFLLLLHIWFTIPVMTVLYFFYMNNRVKREEKVLTEIFGASYQDYCKKVNRFLPSLRGMDGGTLWVWEWRLFVQNHGWTNLAGVLTGLVAAFIWFRIR